MSSYKERVSVGRHNRVNRVLARTPPGRIASRRALSWHVDAALRLLKGNDNIEIDGIDHVSRDELARLTLPMLRSLVQEWKRKNLGYPNGSLIRAVSDCLRLSSLADSAAADPVAANIHAAQAHLYVVSRNVPEVETMPTAAPLPTPSLSEFEAWAQLQQMKGSRYKSGQDMAGSHNVDEVTVMFLMGLSRADAAWLAMNYDCETRHGWPTASGLQSLLTCRDRATQQAEVAAAAAWDSGGVEYFG